jgi:hypothetical protein
MLLTTEEVVPGVFMADTVGSKRYDWRFLHEKLEEAPRVQAIIIRKEGGPLAKLCGGVQYTISLTPKSTLNLPLIVSVSLKTLDINDPKNGVYMPSSKCLHVGENIWKNSILPAIVRWDNARQTRTAKMAAKEIAAEMGLVLGTS